MAVSGVINDSIRTYQKTLVIGIGSTGVDICEEVANHIENEYGGLAKRPWIRICGFETKSVAGRLVGDRGLATHIPLDNSAWAALLRKPGLYDSIEFEKWYDPGTLDLTKIPDVVDGAGHVRMVGRAWFLHPNVFRIFATQIQQHMDQLKGLTQGIGPGGEPVLLEEQVAIFVVGTLLGGTCSGCFIDVGYYLKTQFFDSAKVIGIFSIPHPDSQAVDMKANTYAALTELNHFHSIGGLHTRFATDLSTPRKEIAFPYDSLFLVQPKAPQASAGEYDPLDVIKAATGQMICLNAFSHCTSQLRGEMINVSNTLASNKDKAGRPHSYGTFGLGVLEYPVFHILTGCKSRFCGKAIRDWLNIEAPPSDVLTGLFELQLGLNDVALRRELTRGPVGSESIEGRQARLLREARMAAADGNHRPLDEVAQQLDYGFASSSRPGMAAQPGGFLETLRSNSREVLSSKREAILKIVRDAMLDPRKGPNWCVQFALALREHLSEVVNNDASEKMVANQNNTDRAITNLKRGREGFWVRVFPFLRRMAARKHLESWATSSSRYWEDRLAHECIRFERTIVTELTAVATTLAHRLQGSNQNQGLVPWLRNIAQVLEDTHRDHDRVKPVVSGVLLFHPEQTINAEYRHCLPADDRGVSPAEEEQLRKLIVNWQSLASEVVAAENQSRFDARPGVSAANIQLPTRADIQAITGMADAIFEPIKRTNVLDRWAADVSQRDAQLGKVSIAAKRFLELAGQLAERQDMAGAYDPSLARFAFYRGADGQVDRTPGGLAADFLRNSVGDVDQRVHNDRFVSIDDQYKIVILEARSNFPLIQVAGLQPDGMVDALSTAYRHLSQSRTDGSNPTLHARIDYTWRPIEGIDDSGALLMIVAKILVALPLGIVQLRDEGLEITYAGTGFQQRGGRAILSYALENAAYELLVKPSIMATLNSKLEAVLAGNLDNCAIKIDGYCSTINQCALTLHGQKVTESNYFNFAAPYIVATPRLKRALDELATREA